MLQYINDNAAGVVLIEDKWKSIFMAVGEYFSTDYTPNRFGSSSCGEDKVIRVVLKACTQPEALLLFPVVDSHGKILCRTLKEAFVKKLPA